MRAVNLVPADQRTGGLSGGRSGGMVYAALGGLVVLLLAASLYALAGRDQKQAEQELANVETATQQYQAAASQFAAYEKAASEATARIAAVKGLADARFDWAGAMRDLSRVVPRHTEVREMSASVRPEAGSATTSSPLRAALPVPAITFKGCSETQDTVADLVTRLQAMRRVTQVTLESSIRNKISAPDGMAKAKKPEAEGDTNSGGCFLKTEDFYEITVVVFFAPGTSAQSSDAVAGTTPGATPVASEAAGGTSTTTTSGN